jgi:hypothetical protein
MAKTGRTAATATKVTPATLVAGAATGDERRIVSLGAGTYAYLYHPTTGKIAHVKVDSDAFASIVSEHAAMSAAYAARLERELSQFGGDFPAALDRLRTAGVFTS